MVLGRSLAMHLATGGAAERDRQPLPAGVREPADLHQPVLVDEIVTAMMPVPAGVVIDATVGIGGHADALMDARDDVRLIGLDRDGDSLELADLRLARWVGRYELSHADFRLLPELAKARGWAPLSGVIVDLGFSSLQMDSAERGFSFRLEGPLDMRMDRRQALTAAELVNRLPYSELRALIQDYGEDPQASRIARAIVEARQQAPILSTTELADLIAATVPQRGPQRLHPATLTFQALRIAVNDELTGLYDFVVATARLLAQGGRLAVVAFHSLEDRQVKRAYRYLASNCECPPELPMCVCSKRTEVSLLTSRPQQPNADEVATNPRSRSARLRVLQKL